MNKSAILLLFVLSCKPIGTPISETVELKDGSCVYYILHNNTGCADNQRILPVKTECPKAEQEQ